jgi:hypothetical protein
MGKEGMYVMRANGKGTKSKGKDNSYFHLEIHMKECGQRENLMDWALKSNVCFGSLVSPLIILGSLIKTIPTQFLPISMKVIGKKVFQKAGSYSKYHMIYVLV